MFICKDLKSQYWSDIKTDVSGDVLIALSFNKDILGRWFALFAWG